jgi:hypothetical protein
MIIVYGLKRLSGQLLRDKSNPRTCLAELSGDVITVDEHLTTAGVDDAADDIDQRGLTSAIRAQQAEDLAAVDLEINILECLEPTGVGLGQAFDRNH